MAKRNVYLADNLEERVKRALEDPSTRFSVSGVCSKAIGAALNGEARGMERQAAPCWCRSAGMRKRAPRFAPRGRQRRPGAS